MEFIMTLPIFLIACTCSLSAPSVEISKDNIKLVASLAKNEYIEGEPIIVTLSIVNDSDRSRLLCEPNESKAIGGCYVEKISGEYPLPTRISLSRRPPPTDFNWTFKPAEVRSDDLDLQLSFSSPLPVGTYSARAVYSVPDFIEAEFHGAIMTPVLEFSVIPATGEMAEISKSYRTAKKSNSEESKNTLRALSDPEKGGVFANCAGFYLAAMYQSSDRASFIAMMRDYIKKHSNAPFYGKASIRLLGAVLLRNTDNEAAREVFMQLPDNAERCDWLRRCDKQQDQVPASEENDKPDRPDTHTRGGQRAHVLGLSRI